MTYDYLPKRFETFEVALKLKKKVRAALRLYGTAFPEAIKLPKCKTGKRCHSGLCPVCIRDLRRRLLKFLAKKEMNKRRWYHVTIRVAGWTKAVGDYSAFGELRDHPDIKSLLGKFRRAAGKDLIVFGSIETVYRVVANKPTGKPFHIHLLVSGLKKKVIKRMVGNTFELDSEMAIPLIVDRVKDGETHFVKAASYVFKQPFWKSSYIDENSRRPRKQTPKLNQFAELISCQGAHLWNGRLILLGIRFDQGKFRMT